jgi:outer membrane protein assembly factor BamA
MLAGRPPINVGVTSSGNFYGNTQITFTDLLGDQQFTFFVQSVSQYRSFSFQYLTIEKRMQYAIQAFSQDLYYFGQNAALYDPYVATFLTHDQAEAVQSQRGATMFVIYPFNKYTRAELNFGYMHLNERYNDPVLQQLTQQYQVDQYGSPIFRNGNMIPYGVSLVRETTVFREFGPVAGNTFKVSFSGSPGFTPQWLSRQTVDIDLRHYQRVVANGVLATRLKMFKSFGTNPDFLYFGGNSEMRGYEYLQFLGHEAFFANVELRYPLVEAALTPFGVFGGLRGVFFFDIGGGGFNNQPFNPFDHGPTEIPLLLGYTADLLGNPVPVFGPSIPVNGFRLVDSQASYGLGLQTAILGFPIHFDWAWKTHFNRLYEDVIYFYQASQIDPTGRVRGSDLFRKVKFQFWIGYDF